MSLQRLSATVAVADVLAALEQDGAVIVENVLADDARQRLVEQLDPYISATPMGGDDFSGRNTQRTGALVARTPACHDLILHPLVLAAAEQFLQPYTDKILLHLTQTIHIHPGNPAQPIHRDRLAWGNYIPREIEPQFNTIWALTDFTLENGATRCVPGSHKWDWTRQAEPAEIVQADMPAGSVFIYSGSVLHSGGANQANTARLGLNLTYTLGWLRTEENQYLSCPPHIAATLPAALQELLGYTQGGYALGYYSDPEALAGQTDILPPEHALGRKPRDGTSLASDIGTPVDLSNVAQL